MTSMTRAKKKHDWTDPGLRTDAVAKRDMAPFALVSIVLLTRPLSLGDELNATIL